jgi:hypothetical protein
VVTPGPLFFKISTDHVNANLERLKAREPRVFSKTFFNIKELATSIFPLRDFFHFDVPDQKEIIVSIAIGCTSAIWFEGYKFAIRKMSLK